MSLRLPCPPWLKPKSCVRVDDGRIEPITMTVKDQIELSIDRIEAGDVFLITQDPSHPERLHADFRRRQDRVAAALQTTQRNALRRQAAQSSETRYVPFRYARFKVEGSAIGGYGIKSPSLWNPNREKHNGLEYWEAKGQSRKGVAWTIDVLADRAGLSPPGRSPRTRA